MPGFRDSAAFEIAGTLRGLFAHESQNNAAEAAAAVGPPVVAARPGGLVWLQRTRSIRNFAIVFNDTGETKVPFRGYVQRFQLGPMGTTGLVTFTAAIMPPTHDDDGDELDQRLSALGAADDPGRGVGPATERRVRVCV